MVEYIPFVKAGLEIGKRLGEEVEILQQQLNGTYEGPDRHWSEVADTALWGLETLTGLPVATPVSAPPPPEQPKKASKAPPAPAYVPRAPYRTPEYYVSSQRAATNFGTQQPVQAIPRRW